MNRNELMIFAVTIERDLWTTT